MIKLTDFFLLENPEKTKIKFNRNPANPNYKAWDYLREDDPEWITMNAHKRRHASNNLKGADYLLTFAQYYPYGPEYYIFGGLYKVKMIEPEVFDGTGYELELLDQYKEYRKRLIIKLEKSIGRDIYVRRFVNVQEQLNPEIYELSPSTKLENFHSYSEVSLTHQQLQIIFNEESPEWKKALSSVKGIYCITNRETGQLYIGSASGDNEGIWQRWSSYANLKNLTGGNKTFEDFKKNDAGYIVNNFTYTILEIFDMRTKREDIIHREEYWKRVFKTVEFGMNNVGRNKK